MRAAPNAHRLALLYSEKQASKLQKQELLLSLHSSELWRSFALGSGGTICLSPVDKLISDDDLSLFLIHSSDLQGFLFSNAYNCLALFPSSQQKGAQNECFPIWVSLSGVSPPHSRTHACTHTRTRMHTRAPAPILTPQCPQRRPNAEGRFLAARP